MYLKTNVTSIEFVLLYNIFQLNNLQHMYYSACDALTTQYIILYTRVVFRYNKSLSLIIFPEIIV